MTTTANAKRGPEFGRQRLPERLCNLDRLLADMEARELDGLVVTTPLNVFYLTSFNGIAHKGDEPRPYVVILARREPEHPIMVLADYYLTTPLYQPTWVKDIRPCRSVMAAMDRPPRTDDIDAHIPWSAAGVEWMERARAAYRFDFAEQVRAAMHDLGIDRGRVGFDDEGFGRRLGLENVEIADGYDPLMHARAVKTPAELELLARATRLNEKGHPAHHRALGGGLDPPGSEPCLCRVGGRARWIRARPGRTGGEPRDRRGPHPDGAKRTRGRGDPSRHPRHVRLPRDPRSLLLGRRQVLGRRRRADPGRGRRVLPRPARWLRRSWRACAPAREISELQAMGRGGLPQGRGGRCGQRLHFLPRPRPVPISTSSYSTRTVSPTGTGCWRRTWSSPCTSSIQAASASGRGWRRSW